jgi:hypothetical protein
MMILRCANQGASSKAKGTLVVLPAPGGACSTKLACCAKDSAMAGSKGVMGSDAFISVRGETGTKPFFNRMIAAQNRGDADTILGHRLGASAAIQ